MPNATFDYYSVDAGILIKMKDMLPYDLFTSAWDEITRLASEGRWKIFENVAKEAHGGPIQQWLALNPTAVVKFNPDINKYTNVLMAELLKDHMMLVDPLSLKNNGDPFVVMLGLYLEQRNLSDLRNKTGPKTCCVLTGEELKKNKINIPSVCVHYNLHYMTLFQFMKHHGWQITLKVNNP